MQPLPAGRDAACTLPAGRDAVFSQPAPARVLAASLAALIALLAALAAVAGAQDVVPEPWQGLDITPQGIFWWSPQSLTLLGSDGGQTTFAGVANPSAVDGHGGWIAVRTAAGLAAARGTGPLAAVPAGPSVGSGGCQDWHADTTRAASFAVSGSELVLAGTPACPGGIAVPPAGTATPTSTPQAGTPTQTVTVVPAIVPVLPAPTAGVQPSGPQPLFVHELSGGGWRVLRWLPAPTPQAVMSGFAVPVLAGRWPYLAIGTADGPSMRAQVIDLRSGRTVTDIVLARAQLAVDGEGDLLATIPVLVGAQACDGSLYRLMWAARGAQPTELASDACGQTAIAGGSVAYVAVSGPGYDIGELTVADLRSGAATSLVGFADPLREFLGLDLWGNTLAWAQSTTSALPLDQVTCQSGQFAPQGAPAVQTIDLDDPQPVPAPVVPGPLPASAFAGCPNSAVTSTG